MNAKKQNVIKQCIMIVLGYLVVLGMNVNLNASSSENIITVVNTVFKERGFMAIGLMTLCYIALKPIVLERKVFVRKLDVVLSVMISFCILVGKSFVKYSNFWMFTASAVQLVKCLAVLIAYSIFISVLVSYIRHFIRGKNFFETETKTSGILYLLFEKHPFLTPYLLIMAVWLPFVIIFYPGFLMGDMVAQILMSFNLENHFGHQVTRPNPEIWVTNQHPVLHTAIVGICMRIGYLFTDSDNFGYFLYTFLQTNILAATFAYALSFLTKLKTAYFVRVSILAFYVIHPIFFTYAILGTKDTYFTCLVMIWLITVSKMVYDRKGEGISKKDLIIYFASLIGCVLFRKNAYYMLLVSIPFLFVVIKRMRKVMLVSLIVVIAVQTLYIDVFLKVTEIADGSAKDMFSIPFMQTARYIRDHEEDITAEEKAAIEGVLDYDHIKEKYFPLKSDSVKYTYKNERTDEEFQAYVKAWFEMFLKHPICYVEATVENTYGYYCFLEEPVKNWHYSQITSNRQRQREQLTKHFDIHFLEETRLLRAAITVGHRLFVNLPIIRNVMQSALYFWITIFVAFEYLKKKRFRELGLYLPLLLLLGTCILSPVNGSIYFRYVVPIAFPLPVLLAISLRYKKIEEIEEVK